MTRPPLTVDDPRVEPCPTSGCWLWMGRLDISGYGVVERSYKVLKAHRVMWLESGRSIPEGMVLDHMCRVRSCVNPDHLRVVTTRQNSLENSRGVGAINAAKKVCPRCGGEFSFVWRGRQCTPCKKAKDRERKERGGEVHRVKVMMCTRRYRERLRLSREGGKDAN